jgi:imidazolonepropionase-like amidohydrolase
VLVRGNLIERISASPLAADANVRVIPAGGRVLMPGLIDAHWHTFMAQTSMGVLNTGNDAYLQFLAAQGAEAMLMRGFTTVRDLGGPVFGLKRAIDEGVMTGPASIPRGP